MSKRPAWFRDASRDELEGILATTLVEVERLNQENQKLKEHLSRDPAALRAEVIDRLASENKALAHQLVAMDAAFQGRVVDAVTVRCRRCGVQLPESKEAPERRGECGEGRIHHPDDEHNAGPTWGGH